VLLGVVQLAVVVRDQLAVQLAAREAARAAAVSADGGAGIAAGQRAITLRPLDVRVERSGSSVSVTASFVDHTDVPVIGALLPDVRVSSTATMQWEPP